MQTRLIKLTKSTTPAALQEAAGLLQSGQLVAFPTETVYGLGGNALDAAAAGKIFAAKGRPADNPLIAHIDSLSMGAELADFTPLAMKLAAAFWPGPLTMVLAKKPHVPAATTAGLDSVALRFPAHPVARALITAAGLPIAAPSANLSGRPSPTLAGHVYEDLCGRIPLILDGGAVDIGVESTVVDARDSLPVLLRPGKISREQLINLCGDCLSPGPHADQRPAAPGMKYRHYAPEGQLYLADNWRIAEALRLRLLAEAPDEPLLIISAESAAELQRRGLSPDNMLVFGHADDMDAYAHQAFASLREADRRHALRIIAETVPESGLGRAIMNRLHKAATPGQLPK